MEIGTKKTWHMRLPLLLGFSQLCNLLSQITGFFDHQYICRESIDILNYLHGAIHQGRQHLGLSLLFGYGQLCLLSSQTAGFFDHRYLGKKSINIVNHLHWDYWQGKVADHHFWFGVANCAFWSIRLQNVLSPISLEGISR